jgi:hypothetical protein
MPARCPTCGEEALTETARFCIGCGGALPEQEPGVVLQELAETEPDPEPAPPTRRIVDDAPALHLPQTPSPSSAPSAPPPRREDTPAFTPRPAPSRAEPAPPPRPPVVRTSTSHQPAHRPPQFPPPLRDTSPIVPLPLVVAGVVGLLALLLILLLAA